MLDLNYWPSRSICVIRIVEGKEQILRIFDQRTYKEWAGCFCIL